MNEQNHLQSDQRGITLIEVIVSVLILAIIVVPLLSNFVISSHVNQKSRTRQYATSLASNVMEGIKNYDLADITLQFNGATSERAFKIVPLTTLAQPDHGVGYYETDASFLQRYRLNVDGTVPGGMSLKLTGDNYLFQVNADKKYYYAINNIAEGTKQFDVKITIDSSGYRDATDTSDIKQNKFVLPDVASLDVNETAIINPVGASTTYKITDGKYEYNDALGTFTIESQKGYDDKALDYFRAENERFYYDKYMREYSEVATENAEAIANAPAGVSPVLRPYPTIQPCENDGTLKGKISRKTIITIDNNDVGTGVKVSCEFEYTFHQATEDMIYNSSTIKNYSGFYDDVIFSELDNIYLFHIPLDPSVYKQSMADCIYVINNATSYTNSLRIFVAQQPLGLDYKNINPIYIDAITVTQPLLFYYNESASERSLEGYGGFQLNTSNYNKELVIDLNQKDRIYDVKVDIYEHDSTELIYELTSTVTR